MARNDTGLRPDRANIPRSAVTGTVGRITQWPSMFLKNLTVSPGLMPSASRMALGMVTCPLLVSFDSMYYILAKVMHEVCTKFVLH